MNQLTANLVVMAADKLLQEKCQGAGVTMCTGIYDNYPIGVAELLVTGQPVKFALTIPGQKTVYREFSLRENGQVRILPQTADLLLLVE